MSNLWYETMPASPMRLRSGQALFIPLTSVERRNKDRGSKGEGLYGAGDGTRTRDSLLGGQELYQLSYSRVAF